MSSSRARTLREKNQLIKLVKDIEKRMDSFEEAVNELKILKDSVTELNDEVTSMEENNRERLKSLQNDLKDNTTKVLNDEAKKLGKVIISTDELVELRAEVDKWKQECVRVKASVDDEVKEKVNVAIDHRIKLLELQHERDTAGMKASVESYKKEIENLNAQINRMSQELDSQKKLTANVAGANRPLPRSDRKEE